MVGFAKLQNDIEAIGARIVAASVEPIDKARIVQEEVTFPIAYGVTRAIADQLGSWWEDRRSIIQPSEFILDQNGKVLASSYSDGPLGRIDAADVVRLLTRLEKPPA